MFLNCRTYNLIIALFVLGLTVNVCYSSNNKDATTLETKVQQLMEMSLKTQVPRFNGNKFRNFVKNSPRNYSIIVMFTALSSHHKCAICQQAYEEFQLVARSFRYSQSYSSKLFFAMVNFDEGPDVFEMMKLNMAPVYMHFPAKGKSKELDMMDIQRVGFTAEAIAKWIASRTDVQIRVFRPPNYTGTFAFCMTVAMIAGLLYLRRNNLDFLYNKTAWGLTAFFFVFAMISGQMWNHIRGPPLLNSNAKGQISVIHGSSQGQFVMESYIVMVLYGSISCGMIMLIEAADINNKSDVSKRRFYSTIALVIFAVFFSLILSIFRSKAGGYPYSFLF